MILTGIFTVAGAVVGGVGGHIACDFGNAQGNERKKMIAGTAAVVGLTFGGIGYAIDSAFDGASDESAKTSMHIEASAQQPVQDLSIITVPSSKIA